MRVLVVEDEEAIRQHVVDALGQLGFVVEQAADGEEGIYIAQSFPLDLAIIDLGLPKKSGLEVIQAIRAQGLAYPILILTARDHWQDKVDGLDAGADDYVTKPFHTDEVMARVNALLRRSGGWADKTLQTGPLQVNTRSQAVTLNEKPVGLTSFEYKLLEYFVLHAGRVLSKTQLKEAIYPDDDDADSNVIEVLIGRLRKKLDPTKTWRPIETLRGRGYRFVSSP